MNKLNIYKTKTINFLRKYSLNFFMAIVAINSYSISITLKENRNILNENVKLQRYKEICARYYTFYSSGTDEQAESREELTASLLDVPLKLVDTFCQRMI